MKIDQSIPLQVLRVSLTDPAKGEVGSKLATGDLKVGQFIRAIVVGTTEDGLMQLETDGRMITARSEVSLSAGSEIWLEVLSDGEPPTLSVASGKLAIQDLLKYLFVNTGKMGKILSRIGSISSAQLPGEGEAISGLKGFLYLLNGITLNSEVDPGKILSMVHALSGATREFDFHRLNDIFSGRDGLSNISHLEPGELEALIKIGKLFEVVKSVNHNLSGNDSVDFSLFPFFFSSSSGWGHWMFSAQEEGGSTNESVYSLEFFLDMSRVGEVHISAEVGSDSINASFLVEKEDVEKFFKRELAELTKTLSGYGYSTISLTCRKSDRELRQILKETIEEKGKHKGVSLVNVKV